MSKAKTGRWVAMVAALLLSLGGLTLTAREAHAEEVVRLNTEANLRARPGERAPTLAVIDEGKKVKVLGSKGRWLKVSYKGKVGWLTRTQVDEDDGEVSARPTAEKKRASKKGKARKGWSSMDDDAVGGDAVEDDEEFEDEEEVEAPKKKKKVAKAKPKKVAKKAKPKAKKVAKKAAKPGKGDDVVLVRASSVREKPSKKGEEIWEADEGTAMVVVGVKGDWLKVEDEEGTIGWVAAKDVARAGGDDEEEFEESVEDDEELDEDGDEPRKVKKSKKLKGKKEMQVWAHANLGILSKSQAYSSAGTGLRANYALANTAPAAMAGLGLEKNMGGYTLGVTGGAMMTVGGSGIQIADTGGGMGELLSWKALQLDARVFVGYSWDKKKGYAVQGRAGYHVSSVTVALSDVAKLPSERLSGITVGAALVLPKISPKIDLQFSADYLASGKLEQTANLEDGEQSKVSAFYVGAQGTYGINAKMSAHAAYQLNYEGFGFGGANTREPTATNAQRKDLQHVLGVGVAYLF